MANPKYLKFLKQGVGAWNKWRDEHPSVRPNLEKADLRQANLRGVNLSGARLSEVKFTGADLTRANLRGSDLSGADLTDAKLIGADLDGALFPYSILDRADFSDATLIGAVFGGMVPQWVDFTNADLRAATFDGVRLNSVKFRGSLLSEATFRWANLIAVDLSGLDLAGATFNEAHMALADLRGADLSGAQFVEADLRKADLSDANLVGANLDGANLSLTNLTRARLKAAQLRNAVLIETNLELANLEGCSVYGISAWNLKTDGAEQSNLIITRPPEPAVTVDNLAVAQFIYLLLNNEKIRDVIDTITAKAVLILGRFSPARKSVLDAVREELRRRNYLPILFDFKKPASKDQTGTVEILARMARFIIVDLTDPSSVPHELATVVPLLRTTPIRPLRLSGATGYTMFDDLCAYPWVLATYHYEDGDSLVNALAEVIAPAEELARLLQGR